MKIVVVTGASTGIGRDVAERLLTEGYWVLAGVRKDADAEAWRGKHKHALPLKIDVTLDKSVAAAVEEARPMLEKATEVHLVNNAGIAVAGPIEAVPISRWREQLDVNVLGLVRSTQAFLPFIRRTHGRVVNMSSVSGLTALPYLGPYAASKFAVEAISDSLRREMRQFGVKVVVVEPGPIDTPIWSKNLERKEELMREIPPELLDVYAREFGTFLKLMDHEAKIAVGVEKVTRAVSKALSAKNPRTRYVVGSAVVPAQAIISSMLPDKIVDKLMSTVIK